MEESRAIACAERERTTRDAPESAKMGQQLPVRDGRADVVLAERPAPLIEDEGAPSQATGGERDVGRDHDVIPRDMLDDPVVDGVELLSYHDQGEPILLRDPYARIRHHGR